jgi:hypothetical protein
MLDAIRGSSGLRLFIKGRGFASISTYISAASI